MKNAILNFVKAYKEQEEYLASLPADIRSFLALSNYAEMKEAQLEQTAIALFGLEAYDWIMWYVFEDVEKKVTLDNKVTVKFLTDEGFVEWLDGFIGK